MKRIFNLVSNPRDCHRKSPIPVGTSGGLAPHSAGPVGVEGVAESRGSTEQNGWRMGAFRPALLPTAASTLRRAAGAVFFLVGLGFFSWSLPIGLFHSVPYREYPLLLLFARARVKKSWDETAI
ncbi:hypothetical protein MRX96_024567 [Rhipicephalus microplus]